MSTRCNIIVRNATQSVVLYHHCDGYPEGVGLDLYEMFNEKLNRIDFPKYDVYQVVNDLLKNEEDTGYEVTSGLHGDIEYLYVIDCLMGHIDCYRVSNWESFEVLQYINLAKVKKE